MAKQQDPAKEDAAKQPLTPAEATEKLVAKEETKVEEPSVTTGEKAPETTLVDLSPEQTAKAFDEKTGELKPEAVVEDKPKVEDLPVKEQPSLAEKLKETQTEAGKNVEDIAKKPVVEDKLAAAVAALQDGNKSVEDDKQKAKPQEDLLTQGGIKAKVDEAAEVKAKSITRQELQQMIDDGKVDVGPNGYIETESNRPLYVYNR